MAASHNRSENDPMLLFAGYSKRSLVDKIGIKAGQRLALLGAPRGYSRTLGRLPAGVLVKTRAAGRFDIVHVFLTRRTELARRLPVLMRAVSPDGAVWVSWPKRAAGVATDVTEDVVRDVALPLGLVDVKVCAVDETWSALKLVVRRDLRART